MARLAAIVGSVTPPGRLLRAVSEMVERSRAARPGLDASVINLADVKIAFADGRAPDAYSDDTAAVVDRIAAAEVVLFATPVYRASFTGALKNLIDHLPVEALMGKPCGIVAMGATAHHFLSVEWHLRDVLTWFGSLVAPTAVYLSAGDFVDGVLNEAAAADLDLLVDAMFKLAEVAPRGGRSLGPMPLAARRR